MMMGLFAVHMGHRPMPVSTDDWSVKLSPQARLAVYDYCVQTLKAEGKMANVEKDEVLTTDWERIIKKGEVLSLYLRACSSGGKS